MEIVIDVAFVRGILETERARAREEIGSEGPHRALARSQQRHDARLAAAPDADQLDCREGCSWCCHFSVDVRPAEAFAIADFVAREFPPAAQQRIRDEVRRNGLALRDLDEMDRMTRNVRCPFLGDGRCSIYAVRPQTCRNYHAVDVTGCRQSFEAPGDLGIDPAFAPYVYQAGGAHVEGFSSAMHDAGYDENAYELNAALDAVFNDPGSRERFAGRRPAFAGLAGDEVPPEFQTYIA